MLSLVQRALGEVLGPMLQRPKMLQMAALCHRGDGKRKEYLLITSRDTARWIIPKGWPIRGLKSNEIALQEAWEEAGIKKGKATETPIGAYSYNKRRANGFAEPVETLVFSVAVEEVANDYPEADERKRMWVSAETAEALVDEAELKSIFREEQSAAKG